MLVASLAGLGLAGIGVGAIAEPVAGAGTVSSCPLAAGTTGHNTCGAMTYSVGATAGSVPSSTSEVGIALDPSAPTGKGYWVTATTGAVFSYGTAPFYGSLPGIGVHPDAPISGIAAMPTGKGYWLTTAEGGVFAFGSASYHGSIAGSGGSGGPQTVAIVATTTGNGYWQIDADGGVFSYGSAPFAGSLPEYLSTLEVVGAANWSSGYCMLLADGTLWCFVPGTSPGHVTLCTNCSIYSSPATALADTADHDGLWAVNRIGQVYSYGTAQYEGNIYTAVGGVPWGPITSITGYGQSGYDALGADGGTFSFGAAHNEGNADTSSELSPAAAEAIARVMLPQGDWGTLDQWTDGLLPLWTRESQGWHWNICYGGGYYPTCTFSNTAYGIPQANPGHKMCGATASEPACPVSEPTTAYETNAWTQIGWGLWYISDSTQTHTKFHTPESAYAFDVANNGYVTHA